MRHRTCHRVEQLVVSLVDDEVLGELHHDDANVRIDVFESTQEGAEQVRVARGQRRVLGCKHACQQLHSGAACFEVLDFELIVELWQHVEQQRCVDKVEFKDELVRATAQICLRRALAFHKQIVQELGDERLQLVRSAVNEGLSHHLR